MVDEATDPFVTDPAKEADLFQSTDQVRYHRFTLTRKGYEPQEVLEYLADVAEWIDQLQAAVRRLDAKVRKGQKAEAATETGSDPYDRLASRLAAVLRSAEEYAAGARQVTDEEVEARLAEASERGEDVLRRAAADAEQIRSEADRLASEARTEAERSLSTVWPINSTILTTVRGLHGRLLEITGEMERHVQTLEEIDRSTGRDQGARSPELVAEEPLPRIEQAGEDVIDLSDVTPADP